MYITMNRIFVGEEFKEGFEERFRTRSRSVDGMPGFQRNMVLRPDRHEQPYIVMTFWETETHFQNWVNSDAFKQGHARSGTLPQNAFTQKNHLETYEGFLDSMQETQATSNAV